MANVTQVLMSVDGMPVLTITYDDVDDKISQLVFAGTGRIVVKSSRVVKEDRTRQTRRVDIDPLDRYTRRSLRVDYIHGS